MRTFLAGYVSDMIDVSGWDGIVIEKLHVLKVDMVFFCKRRSTGNTYLLTICFQGEYH